MTDQARRLRRASITFWSLIVAAIALAAVPVLVGARTQYHAGLSFEKGLHAFSFFVSLVYIVPTALIALLLCCIALLIARQSKRIGQTIASILALASCIVVGLAAFQIMGAAFRAGRDRAYGESNLTAIASACAKLESDVVTAEQRESGYWVGEGYPDEYARLPDEILALRPAGVFVGRRGIILQMDGGGPAAHEGFFIPTTAPAGGCAAFATANAIKVLSCNPPVFRFSLYDCRSLPWD